MNNRVRCFSFFKSVFLAIGNFFSFLCSSNKKEEKLLYDIEMGLVDYSKTRDLIIECENRFEKRLNVVLDKFRKNLQFARQHQVNQVDNKDFAPDAGNYYGIHVDSDSFNFSNCNISLASTIGLRDVMQDDHSFGEIEINDMKFPFFSLYDGHGRGGEKASFFVKTALPMEIQRNLFIEMEKYGLNDLSIYNVCKKSFINVDDRCVGINGTTAILAFILNDFLYVANSGDSRAFIKSSDETIQLTEDMKPENGRYAKRIIKRGGEIFLDQYNIFRVNKRTSFAGSIGDRDVLGSFGLPCITARPKVTKFRLNSGQKYTLCIACDGLFDAASTKQVSNAIDYYQITKKISSKETAKNLAIDAIGAGSDDNISIMLVEVFA